jgi:hypothetical protein
VQSSRRVRDNFTGWNGDREEGAALVNISARATDEFGMVVHTQSCGHDARSQQNAFEKIEDAGFSARAVGQSRILSCLLNAR